ncbi:hypothetical protein CsatB_015375 [Cannabis sativa]
MGNSHTHNLILQQESNDHIKCCICSDEISEPPFIECESCDDYYSHITCEEFISSCDDQINHPFHPSHQLKLSRDEFYFICSSCHQIHFFNPCFTCDQCNFYIDIKCFRMPPITCDDDQEHIQHVTHQHPMPLLRPDETEDIECFACHVTCSGEGEACYGCKPCKYFLHKSCAQLPLQIKPHSCHDQDHPLSLFVASKLFITCKICYKDNLLFTYGCGECDFHLCINCATTMFLPIFKYKYHHHPLYFVEKIHTKLDKCHSYDSYCQNPMLQGSVEFKYTTSSIFFCIKCDFKLHFLCGMLPRSIKYEYHIHPLTLTDLVIENENGEYCCDICESEREPRVCVYYCEDCVYIAHVHCLAPQIINIFKGDVKDVNLKMIGEDMSKFIPLDQCDNVELEEKKNGMPQLNLKDLISKLDATELMPQLKHHRYKESILHMLTYSYSNETKDEYIDDILRFSSFTERKFMSVIYNEFHKNYLEKKIDIASSDLELKLVDVEGYLIPLNYVFVMKYLLHKCGDISEINSTSSPTLKSICFFFICKVMKKMHSTLLIDVTKDLLQQWYQYISFSKQCAHFEVDFLNVVLRKITRYFFYLQVSKLLGSEIPTIINEKKAELQEEMNEKMEKIQKKISMNKARLEKCKKFCEYNSKKEFMKKGLNRVMTSKWKTAGHVGF